MRTGPNISIVGAGSITFSMTLIRDLIAKDDLAGSTVTLMDTNPERLSAVLNLAWRLVSELGRPDLNFQATSERRRALEGADFVINTAAIGERDLWPANREVARRHGYWSSKGFRLPNLRNTPLALSIARDMEEVCPNAWLLQYANPMVSNVGAVTRYSKIKAFGVCHGIPGSVRELCNWMGLDRDKIDAKAVGINHFVWLTEFKYDGEDAYPQLGSWLESEFPRIWETENWKWSLDKSGPIVRDLFAHFNCFPCNGDEHLTDYFDWYTRDEESRKSYRAKINYLDTYLERGKDRRVKIQDLVRNQSVKVTSVFKERSNEKAIDLITCLWYGGKISLHLNIPNQGALAGFPDDACVELPAMVSKDRVERLEVTDLPKPIAAHVQRRLAEEEMQMQAALSEDRNLLFQSLLLNAYTRSPNQVRGYLKDLAELEKEYVPWL